VGERVQLGGNGACLLELGPTLRAGADVRLERRHAEAHLPVEEQVDLVWK
jgi:hypothetical protein